MPQRRACEQPGVGCSAGAVGSAAGLHGRCPVGHLAWGQDGGNVRPDTTSRQLESAPPSSLYLSLRIFKGPGKVTTVRSDLAAYYRKENGKKLPCEEGSSVNSVSPRPELRCPICQLREECGGHGVSSEYVPNSWEPEVCFNTHFRKSILLTETAVV